MNQQSLTVFCHLLTLFKQTKKALIFMNLIGPCENFPCQNGAACTDLSLTDYQCQCPSSFEGRDCETRIISENKLMSNMNYFYRPLITCAL